MRFAMLDLMPLLWILSVLLSGALALYGEHAAPARTVPAAAAALILYGYGFPPRLQTAVFLAIYAFAAAVYAILIRLSRRSEKKSENISKTA